MKHTAADEVAMIEDPDRWPIWPRLPLKKRGTSTLGFVFGDPTRPLVIHVGNIWSASGETVEYEDAAAAVADGWVVD